jgi:hypothetical protein
MTKRTLPRLEALIEHLLEGSVLRLFGNRLGADELTTQLARLLADQSGRLPATIRLHLHPADYEAILAAEPEIIATLTTKTIHIATALNLQIQGSPSVLLVANESQTERTIRIETEHANGHLHRTAALDALPPPVADETLTTARAAHLILDGGTTIALSHPVINIGRRADNHIVIEDPRISRSHAQLRLRLGRYVLYDLASRSGTRVNGQPIRDHVLRSGDVITLANNQLIYLESEPLHSESDEQTAIEGRGTDTQAMVRNDE